MNTDELIARLGLDFNFEPGDTVIRAISSPKSVGRIQGIVIGVAPDNSDMVYVMWNIDGAIKFQKTHNYELVKQ